MRTLKLLLGNIAVLWSTVWCISAEATEPFFMGLGDLAGGTFSSTANGVSADGSVVVGSSAVATAGNPQHPQTLFQAFRWTLESGMVGLGDLPGGPIDSGASGVSADGSVIVGSSAVDTISSHGEPPFRTLYRAFRWTQGQGMINLGRLQNSNTTSFADDVSADGAAVVGMSGIHPLREAAHGEAFRWRQGPGMVGLGELPGYDYSHGSGVSSDGSVIVGRSWSGAHIFVASEAFRWSQDSGMDGLGDLPGGQLNSHAYGVSADGSVVVGYGSSAAGSEAFRWTQPSGMVSLGILPSFSASVAHEVSADGSIVVGHSGFDRLNPREAFLWDATHGMRSLRNVLVSDFGLGASLAGWTLTSANDISADGQFIVGAGINPAGNTEAWLARLAPAFPGDFNHDGAVNAADYTTWRNGLGTIYTRDDYNVWKAHYGESLGSGAGASADLPNRIVPEPSSFFVATISVFWLLAGRGRATRSTKTPRHSPGHETTGFIASFGC